MHGVIMAGGKGTRMLPLTRTRPKPLLPLMGRPMIGYVLDHLKEHGVEAATISVGYGADAIRAVLGSGTARSMMVQYAVEDEPLGTAGGVRHAANRFSGRFVVMSGDVVTGVNLDRAIRFHQEHDGLVTVILTRVKDPSAYGAVELGDEGRIRAFVEKPAHVRAASTLVSTGMYICDEEVLDWIPADQQYDFARDLFPRLLSDGRGRLFGWEDGSFWADLGTPAAYLRSHRSALDGWLEMARLGRELLPGVWTEGGASLPADGIRPPVYIGTGSQVEAGAQVGPGTVLGRGVHVKSGASVSGSVLYADVTVAEGAVVKESIIGRRSEVGPKMRISSGVLGDNCHLFGNGMVEAG